MLRTDMHRKHRSMMSRERSTDQYVQNIVGKGVNRADRRGRHCTSGFPSVAIRLKNNYLYKRRD